MTIDKQALREAATEATQGGWYVDYDFDVCHESGAFLAETHGDNLAQNAKFIAAANPATMLALLDELDSTNGYASAYEAEKWHYHGLAESEGERADRAEKQVEELTMWVKRLAHSLRNAKPNSKLHSAAMDYLSHKGLISVEDVLR
ncbi:ead/Ea22-like family protein [Salmonella enterica subsp. diarizonae serovar 35:k:e,n,x,z15]|nr:ead/Ea22-like family protein [Salmonella enterica]EAW1261385.1 ead/Ea22-like family protein [Salmonella enterica subsp. diarizonae]EIE2761265.1 ead/Ea22-like family protein [Salmonella enterica subsp. diarizonae serovar 35:k:e,n,x,z15]MJN96020.1 ead/Ea22-like family protein [Salmonella enterica subsp. enterica serovar Richmond]EBF9341192.1 ead/Ea22-like family protein [Salmonella enterica]